jgi:tRNA pseudouridine13 synthase
MKHSVKQFSLPGSYRNIVSRPGDLTWRLHGYASFDDKIAVTDADVLDGNATPPPSVPNAPLHALLMDFTLGQGEYATMFLREALKISTASNYHFALSNSMKDE